MLGAAASVSLAAFYGYQTLSQRAVTIYTAALVWLPSALLLAMLGQACDWAMGYTGLSYQARLLLCLGWMAAGYLFRKISDRLAEAVRS